MSSFSRVPVVDVHTDNISEVWPSMIKAMSNATFIALDTELSGLGNRKKLSAKSIDDRYKNICDIARSHSVLSLGMSCFHHYSSQESEELPTNYIVQTFNLSLFCEEPFTVEPASLRFLVRHGYDFNRQFAKGISYLPGDDKANDTDDKTPRHLFMKLCSMNVPIIFHNGLVDLMFLYENLYTSLPATSAMFLADLIDLFPSGVIDTKYITDFEHLMQASYLEYVFRKCQKENETLCKKCVVHHPHYPPFYQHVTYRDCSSKPAFNIDDNPDAYKQAICYSYAGHGWCSREIFCPKSHDIDLIIDMDIHIETRKSRKRKRRQQNRKERESLNNSSDLEEDTDENDGKVETKGENSENVTEQRGVTAKEILEKLKSSAQSSPANSGHRAGYDAFMTGFIFASFKASNPEKVSQWRNKLYLTGKDYPFTISKSNFAKQSQQHLQKIAKIRKMTSGT